MTRASNCCKLVILVFVAIPHFSCQKREQPQLLQPALFAKVYTDIVSQSLDSTPSDTLAPAQQVLDRYQIGRALFDTSLAVYERQPEVWVKIMDQVTKELEGRQRKQSQERK